jgi:hypothetical protein
MISKLISILRASMSALPLVVPGRAHNGRVIEAIDLVAGNRNTRRLGCPRAARSSEIRNFDEEGAHSAR